MISKANLTAKVLQLERLLDYQPNSIVSKTIIDKKAGTVSLFAFDQEQGLSAHTAPFDAMVQILDGEAEIMIDRHKHPLKKGETIIMPANQSHAVKALSPFKMLLVMIKQ